MRAGPPLAPRQRNREHGGVYVMKLTVRIAPNRFGILEARVVMHGRAGDNLLGGRMLTKVTTAQLAVREALQHRYPAAVAGFDIAWELGATDPSAPVP